MMSASQESIQRKSFLQNYFMISRLGFGSFGCAVLAKHKGNIKELFEVGESKRGTLLEPLRHNSLKKPHSNGLVAIKVMKNQLRKPEDYLKMNEIKFILSVPSHQNLLQIFDLFIDSFSGKLNIVMEPMDQNLYQFMQKHEGRPVSNRVVKSILVQLLYAIDHIHSQGYFHRDIKPENILISATKQYYDNHVPPEYARYTYILKLCDYGLARHVTNTRDLTQYVSTRWYRAPEILLRQKHYSRPIDIWAFACVAVELVNFRPLFAGINETDQIWQILTKLGHPLYQDRSPDDLGGIWPEGVQLAEKLGFVISYISGQTIKDIVGTEYAELAYAIKNCFQWDPKERPTAESLVNGEFFSGPKPTSQGEENSPLDSLMLELSRNESIYSIAKSTDVEPNEMFEGLFSGADVTFLKHNDSIWYMRNEESQTPDESNSVLELQLPDLTPQQDSSQKGYSASKVRFDEILLQADTSFGSHEIQC